MTARRDPASSEAVASLWGREYLAPVVGVLALMTFIAFEAYAIVTALPVVAADLAAEDWYSFAFAATVATGLVGMIIGGNWADRSGIRLPLIVGGSLFLLGLALSAAAPTMGVFLAGRLLQGFGGGIDSVIAYVLIAGLIPERLQPRMFGLLVTAWLLPAIVGPLVTGIIVEQIGWRAVFTLVLSGSAIALLALIRVSTRMRPVRTDTAMIGARGIWAIVACLGVIALHTAGHFPLAWMITAIIAGGVIVVIATRRLMPPGTLTARPGPPRLILLKGLLGATVAATDIYFTRYLQRELDYSPTLAGLLVAIGAIGWVTGSWLGGRAGDHGPQTGRLWIAASLVAAGPLAVLALVLGLLPVPVAVTGCVLMGVGMGFAYPRITSTALAQTAPEHHGNISSALQSVEQLGTATLTAITSVALITLTNGYPISYALITSIALAAVVVTLLEHPNRAAP